MSALRTGSEPVEFMVKAFALTPSFSMERTGDEGREVPERRRDRTMRDTNLRRFDVYLEVGAKRVFACSVDWPGWCRSGRDEATALQVLLDYGSR
jgi:hypothetical protein